MRYLLVGQHFSLGAVAVITKGMRQAASVMLVAEPENPYDPNAVRVFVVRGSVAESDALDEALAAFGLNFAALQWPFVLGHLGAKYETKAAKAALREGHQFRLAAEWHREARAEGWLMQHSDGTNMVEVAGG